eukprot:ANDGO_06766.mRNA.1 Intraflagellar transport protein 43
MSAPLAGRRAGKSDSAETTAPTTSKGGWDESASSSSSTASSSSSTDVTNTASSTASSAVPPSGPRRRAGVNSDADSGKSKQGSGNTNNNLMMSDDDSDAIPAIPDLDDESAADETAMQTVSDAPTVLSTKVQSLKELDREVRYFLPQPDDPDVDLGALVSTLAPAEHVFEDDAIWDPQAVFTEIISQMDDERNATATATAVAGS